MAAATSQTHGHGLGELHGSIVSWNNWNETIDIAEAKRPAILPKGWAKNSPPNKVGGGLWS